MGSHIFMKKPYNALKKTRVISKNKVTGKLKKNIDIQTITNKKDHITDMVFEYYNSKFQFSDFYNKVIMDQNWVKKPPFLLEAKKGIHYQHTPEGIDLAYYHLISLYEDLDKNLERLAQGYRDSMFTRFALSSGIFTTEQHWQMLLRNWYMGFTYATRRYFNACHHKYDFNSTMSYVAYFDMYFSKYLFYAIGRADQTNQENFAIDLTQHEYVRLDQVNPNLLIS